MTTYGAVAIVKDAANSIEACLESAIAAGVTVATVVDTGSSDDTMARVEVACAGIDLRLSQSSWRNFGHNRSEAFSLARGSADWLLALDADMTVELDPDFEPDPAVDCYLLEMGEGGLSWRLPLLLRGDLEWRSVGAVHEYTALPDRQYRGEPTDKVRVHFPPTQSSPSKRHWHAGMLEEELEREPDNPRTLFYLANTYRELGDPRARDLYLRRVGMAGFEEEAWYALYRAALLADWPGRAAELMAAWERRPSRLEPLYHLVRELNQRGSHRAAYGLSLVAVSSTTDVLFVEADVYRFGLMFERSIAAWWAGHREEARLLGEELLTRDLPDHIRAAAIRNLSFTEEQAA